MDPAKLLEKALLVQNLNSLLTALEMSDSEFVDKLTIHFQRKANHGGDVVKVVYPLNSLKDDAFVIFADANDMLSAAQHKHMFKPQPDQMFESQPLTVRRLPPVFTTVEARIDPLYFNIMPLDASASFPERIDKVANVQVDKFNAGKISCSRPTQLELVEREVWRLVINRASDSASSECAGFEAAGASNFDLESRPMRGGREERGYGDDEEMEVAEDQAASRPTGALAKQSDEPEHLIAARKEHAEVSDKKQRSAQDELALKETYVDRTYGFVNSADKVVLDKYTYNYLKEFQTAALNEISKCNGAQLKINEGDDIGSFCGYFFPSNTKTPVESVAKAKDEFISFYQKSHYEIKRKTIDCSSADAANIEKAMGETCRQFKADTLITKVDGSPHLCLILRRGDVEKVARQFRKIAGIRSGKTLRSTGPPRHGAEVSRIDRADESTKFGKDSPEARHTDGQQNTQSSRSHGLKSGSPKDDMSFTTNEGMRIGIRTADITKLAAHAVVISTDASLKNEYGGVAKAIMEAACPELSDYCYKVMSARPFGYTYLGKFECILTPAFKLKYNKIIFVHGPNYPTSINFRSDLYSTFGSSLCFAEHNKISSLAIPLIGSGAMGCSKSVCADVLAQALVNFSRESRWLKFVREVLLVNIDEESSKAIQKSLLTIFSPPSDATPKSRQVPGPDRSAAVGSGVSQPAYGDGRKSTGLGQDKSWGSHHSPVPGFSHETSLKQGDSKVQAKKQHPVSNMKPDNQHLASDENQQGPLGGKGPASHHVSPAGQPNSTGDQGGPSHAKPPAESSDDQKEVCPICLADKLTDPVTLECTHRFCKACIDRALKTHYRCPVCQAVCKTPTGNQPQGTMSHTVEKFSHLRGYDKDGVIVITYAIPGGTQSADHPNPGKHFWGTNRTAYLPDNQEGREVLGLLKKAFDAGLVFTIGTSVTRGEENTVTWNDIHHKTSRFGGPQSYGYPDPDYLNRVKKDLAAKGIQ